MSFARQFQQIERFLKDKEKILLLTHRRMDGDALGSILALYLFLKKFGKEVTVVCSEPIPSALKFLPTTQVINTEFSGVRDFIVTLDTTHAEVDKMKYSVEEDKVNIIVTSKKGFFSEKNVSFHRGENKYDLLIILDTPVMEQLGSLYDNNVEMYFAIPIVNIDHHVSNVHFGQLNLVDVTASSTTEILFELFQYLQKDKKFIDKDIATLLLAGIITDTGSFKNSNTTPKCLEIAADLYDLGADQQEIIKNVYKTKRLATLKLWGKVLSKLQNDPFHRIVWSTISQKDFKDTSSVYEDGEGIIDELISNAPGAEVFVLIKEMDDHTISVSFRTVSPQVNASEIANLFGGGGHLQAAGCKIQDYEQGFESMAVKIIDKIKEYQKKRLGLNKEVEIEPVEEEKTGKKHETKEKFVPKKTQGGKKSIDVMKVVKEKDKKDEEERE